MGAVVYIDGVKVLAKGDGSMVAYYNDWAVANGYYRKEDMIDIMYEQGYTEEQVAEGEFRMEELFIEWCEIWGVLAYD